MVYKININAVNNIVKELLKSSLISKFPVPYSYKKLIAFTLAEVLIALLIIGVVASLTIPGIMQNTQEAEYKIAWKKIYSDLDQATTMILMNIGTDFNNYFSDEVDIKDQYIKYLKNLAEYDNNYEADDYWIKANPKWLSGEILGADWVGGSVLILNNGAVLLFQMQNDSKDCKKTSWWGDLPKCGIIWVDVNGARPPNTWGTDIYGIQIHAKGIRPMGAQGDGGNESSCSNTRDGIGCSAKYLYN